MKVEKNTEYFWEIKVRNSRRWGQKQRKIFYQRSPDRSEELKSERCQESAAFYMVGMDEGQKGKWHGVLRETESTGKQFCTGSSL